MAKRENGTGPKRGDGRHIGCRSGGCGTWREGFGTHGNHLLGKQGLLKKHQVFETDLDVHSDQVKQITDTGMGLVKQVDNF